MYTRLSVCENILTNLARYTLSESSPICDASEYRIPTLCELLSSLHLKSNGKERYRSNCIPHLARFISYLKGFSLRLCLLEYCRISFYNRQNLHLRSSCEKRDDALIFFFHRLLHSANEWLTSPYDRLFIRPS